MSYPSFATAPTRIPGAFIALVGGSAWERQVYDFVIRPCRSDATKTWIYASGMDASGVQRILRWSILTSDLQAGSNASLTYDGVMLDVGGVGDWDEDAGGTTHGIRLCSIQDDGAGTDEMYYYSDNAKACGVATSTDGTNWTKYASNPILTDTGQGRNDGTGVGVGNMAVINEGGVRTAVYSYNLATLPGYRTATANDPFTWTKTGSGDVLNVETGSLVHEFHALVKLGPNDYIMLPEIGSTTTYFSIYVARATSAAGPYQVSQTPWFERSAAGGTIDQYQVATATLYLFPGTTQWLFMYCGSSTQSLPANYASSLWSGCIATVTNLSETLGDNLVHFWPLDEVSGSRAARVGGVTLTDNNTVTQATNANWRGGLAALFTSGNSEYLEAASQSSLLLGNQDWTIAFWMMSTITSGVFFSKDADTPANARDFTIDLTAGNLRGYISGGGTAIVTTPFSASVRYLVIFRHNAAADTISLQLNLGTPASASTSGVVPDTGAGALRIGARVYAGFQGYMTGMVANAGIWVGKCLSTNEAAELYSRGAGLSFERMLTTAGGGSVVGVRGFPRGLRRGMRRRADRRAA